jgi:Lon protease-like protein
MIGECVDARKPFGVVLIKKGTEALGPLAEPHPIGCMAQITQVQRLGQGRLNIAAIGRERFRIHTLERDAPYLIGQVEEFPMTDWPPEQLSTTAEQLRPFIQKYMERLSQIEGVDLDITQIPHEPVKLAYFAAGLLQVPSEQKQSLLAAAEAAEMLDEMRGLYRREISFIKHMLEQPFEDDGSFSLN